MSWLGYHVAREFSDLVKSELAPSADRGDSYLLPDEVARQAACAKLGTDPGIDASKVEVRVLSGVLRLSGSVPKEAMKALAEQLCAAVSGVTKVENELTVR